MFDAEGPEPTGGEEEGGGQGQGQQERLAVEPGGEGFGGDGDGEGDGNHRGQGKLEPRGVDADGPATSLVEALEDDQHILDPYKPE